MRARGLGSTRCLVAAGALACLRVGAASGQGARATGDTTPKLDVYGSGQADMILDLRRNDPFWFDVNRPAKLPSSSTSSARTATRTSVRARAVSE